MPNQLIDLQGNQGVDLPLWLNARVLGERIDISQSEGVDCLVAQFGREPT